MGRPESIYPGCQTRDSHILGKNFRGKLTPLSHVLYLYLLGMLISDSDSFSQYLIQDLLLGKYSTMKLHSQPFILILRPSLTKLLGLFQNVSSPASASGISGITATPGCVQIFESWSALVSRKCLLVVVTLSVFLSKSLMLSFLNQLFFISSRSLPRLQIFKNRPTCARVCSDSPHLSVDYETKFNPPADT